MKLHKTPYKLNGTVIVQKELRVQGTGSSATIDRNMTVGGQVYFTNSTLGLTHTGQANSKWIGFSSRFRHWYFSIK
jgi:hypothetical protein